MRIADSIINLVGETPIIKLSRITEDLDLELWCKCEFMNPTGSIKDRIALYMIRSAEREGRLKPGMKIVVATTGNTGISFAAIGSILGYRVVIVMPREMSTERTMLIKHLGAEIIYTPGGEANAKKALDYSRKLEAENPSEYCCLDQWSDEANIRAHYETTGREILEQIGSDIDAFVAGVGTGGTLVGVGLRLKEVNPEIKVYGVEPAECPFISKGVWGRHKIEGIGDGFIPRIIEEYRSIIDGWILVSSLEAIEWARRIARIEGLLVGISSGANIAASIKLARNRGLRRIVTILPDNAMRYYSTELFRDEL